MKPLPMHYKLCCCFLDIVSFLVTAGEAEFQVVSNDTDNGLLCTQVSVVLMLLDDLFEC